MAADGPQMDLRWSSDGQQNASDGLQIVSDAPQNTSLVSDRHQMCFVDGCELQKLATQIKIPTCPISLVWKSSFVKV